MSIKVEIEFDHDPFGNSVRLIPNEGQSMQDIVRSARQAWPSENWRIFANNILYTHHEGE